MLSCLIYIFCTTFISCSTFISFIVYFFTAFSLLPSWHQTISSISYVICKAHLILTCPLYLHPKPVGSLPSTPMGNTFPLWTLFFPATLSTPPLNWLEILQGQIPTSSIARSMWPISVSSLVPCNTAAVIHFVSISGGIIPTFALATLLPR